MAGLYFAVLCMCVHILMSAPVQHGESQIEITNKLLNNTLQSTNETVTSCQNKLSEATNQLANYKKQKMDLELWMTQISQAINLQQQLMHKLHIDIDNFLGWTHGPNGTLQFPMINESFVSNETDGIDEFEPWDDDFPFRRTTGWLTQQNIMSEGKIVPESPSEPKPGLVEPLEVVDYEGEGGLSAQTEKEENENEEKEVIDNNVETVISKEVTVIEAAEKPEDEMTEVGNEVDEAEEPDNAKSHHGINKGTETSPGASKPIRSHHNGDNQHKGDNGEQKTNEQKQNEEEPEQEDQMELEQPKQEQQTELEQENEQEQPEKVYAENEHAEREQQENEQVEQKQDGKGQENEKAVEKRKPIALHVDEGPQEKDHKQTGRYNSNSKLGRKLMGVESARTSNSKPEVHPAESTSENTQSVQDWKKQMDVCLSEDNQREGFNELHGMERYTEQNSVSQRLKVLECVLNVMKGMPAARQNMFMSRLQRFIEAMEHWEK